MFVKKARFLIRSIPVMMVFICSYVNNPHAAQLISNSSSISAACGPDKPIVFSGKSVNINAWATSSVNQPMQYGWTATEGKITGEGSEASWDFTGVWPGIKKATVTIRDSAGAVIECTIQVIVHSPAKVRDKKYKTGRAFLVSGKSEAQGYGLYSYLLLNSRPSDETRKRYLKAIVEYLRFTDISLFEKAGIDPAGLNITYLLVDAQPGPEILDVLAKKDLKEKELLPIAEWVLQHYDYVRAELLLDALAERHNKGPYIVSFRKPHDWEDTIVPPYLYQDQSWVPPDLVSEWMNVFLNQAAQEQFWTERTGEQLVLNLRTIIGVVAAGVPDIKNSLTGWITWIRKIA